MTYFVCRLHDPARANMRHYHICEYMMLITCDTTIYGNRVYPDIAVYDNTAYLAIEGLVGGPSAVALSSNQLLKIDSPMKI